MSTPDAHQLLTVADASILSAQLLGTDVIVARKCSGRVSEIARERSHTPQGIVNLTS